MWLRQNSPEVKHYTIIFKIKKKLWHI
jgi:hypothetical protein